MSKFEAEKTVYIVRHGQSEANIADVFQGPDARLTERGREQAAQIAARASRLPIEAIVSSALPRAHETAEIIAATTGKPMEVSELFAEVRKPSRIYGRSRKEAEAYAIWERWIESTYVPGARVEDGETYDELLGRTDAALAHLAARPEKEILVVTHGIFLRTIMARVLLGDTFSGKAHQMIQFHSQTENSGLTVLQYGTMPDGPGWRFWIFNDHAHLAG